MRSPAYFTMIDMGVAFVIGEYEDGLKLMADSLRRRNVPVFKQKFLERVEQRVIGVGVRRPSAS